MGNASTPLEEHIFIATGRLHHGQFHGFVVIQGVLSNDPTSCSSFVHPGIGFVGNFKNGKPNGVGWRELLGGGWIFGELNEEGRFTGIKHHLLLFISVTRKNCQLSIKVSQK